MPSAEAAALPVDASAFDLPGAGRAAALCLHGLTGTPYEVRPLGAALSAAGVRAVGPVLPGHLDEPSVLAAVHHEQWIEHARRLLRALQAEHEMVFVVGLSMGGLVALCLAAEEPVAGVVVVGTPLRLRPPLGVLVPWLRFLVPFPPKRGGSDIREPRARARHPSLSVMPLAAVHQLQQLQRRARSGLSGISAPLLVAHGVHDRTADPADSRRILASVSSRERELLLLPDSAHVVPVDYDGPRLAEATVRFLTRRLPASRPETTFAQRCDPETR